MRQLVTIGAISCLYMLMIVFLYFVSITPLQAIIISVVMYLIIIGIMYYGYRARVKRFLWFYPIIFLLSPRIAIYLVCIALIVWTIVKDYIA